MRTYVQTVWMETMPSAHDKHEIITLKKSKILVESNRNSTQCTFHDYVEFHLFKAQINFNFICLPIEFKLTFQLWFLQRVAEIGLTLSFPHPLNFIYFLGLRNFSGLGPRRITPVVATPGPTIKEHIIVYPFQGTVHKRIVRCWVRPCTGCLPVSFQEYWVLLVP